MQTEHATSAKIASQRGLDHVCAFSDNTYLNDSATGEL